MPKKTFPVLGGLCLSLVAVTITLLLPTQLALAATCYGGNCNNTNPQSMGCAVRHYSKLHLSRKFTG